MFASPRIRALETARIACAALNLEPTVVPALGGAFDEDDALELVAATGDGGALMLVGHEPTLSGLVWALSGARIDMKKGGLAALRLGGGGGQLLVLLRPREVELLADL